jgi:cytochrome bd-type quinol oxidase subunit 1
MPDFTMMMWAYCTIVALTMILVLMNIHSTILQLQKDRNLIRCYSYLATLTITGAMIIVITGSVIDHVISSQNALENDNVRIARAHRY